MGSEGQGCPGSPSPSVPIPSQVAQPSSDGRLPARARLLGSRRSALPSRQPRSSMGTSSLWACGLPSRPSCLSHLCPKCGDGPQAAPPSALTPLGLDAWTLQPEVAQDEGAGKASPREPEGGDGSTGSDSDTADPHLQEGNVWSSLPAGTLCSGVDCPPGLQGPRVRTPTASLQMPLCRLNLT